MHGLIVNNRVAFTKRNVQFICTYVHVCYVLLFHAEAHNYQCKHCLYSLVEGVFHDGRFYKTLPCCVFQENAHPTRSPARRLSPQTACTASPRTGSATGTTTALMGTTRQSVVSTAHDSSTPPSHPSLPRLAEKAEPSVRTVMLWGSSCNIYELYAWLFV